MTNGEKFKTAQERAEAFLTHIGYNERKHGWSASEAFSWIDLEAEEKPLPCIWCNHETYICEGQNYGQVRCRNCMAEGPATDSKENAIRSYNRVAKKCMEGK